MYGVELEGQRYSATLLQVQTRTCALIAQCRTLDILVQRAKEQLEELVLVLYPLPVAHNQAVMFMTRTEYVRTLKR